MVVVNPRQVRDFAKGIGKNARTDAIDTERFQVLLKLPNIHNDDRVWFGHWRRLIVVVNLDEPAWIQNMQAELRRIHYWIMSM